MVTVATFSLRGETLMSATPTTFTTTTDDHTHSVEKVNGHKVTVDTTEDLNIHTTGEFDSRVMDLIRAEDARRQVIEDTRANRRNRNRIMTLLAAIFIGLGIVWTLPHLGHIGMVMAPYSFVITVLFDSALTIYAYIRHY